MVYAFSSCCGPVSTSLENALVVEFTRSVPFGERRNRRIAGIERRTGPEKKPADGRMEMRHLRKFALGSTVVRRRLKADFAGMLQPLIQFDVDCLRPSASLRRNLPGPGRRRIL